MIEKKESEVMQHWKNSNSTPLVSICVITYNHEKYIGAALDSFLSQETENSFEIVIGEDCSTDNTPNILKKYLIRFPHIIRLISSDNNVGMKKNLERTLHACRGEYIALCEGDDYWSDSAKLIKQVNAMRQHLGCQISFHRATELYSTGRQKEIANYGNKNKIFSVNEVILGRGEFCPTSSLMVMRQAIEKLPQWYYEKILIGDYYLQVLSSLSGDMLYIAENMSTYRRDACGNWSNATDRHSDKTLEHFKQMQVCLKLLDSYTEQQYSKELAVVTNNLYYSLLAKPEVPVYQRRQIYQQYKNNLTLKQKLFWLVIFSIPVIHQLHFRLRKIKQQSI